MSIPNTKALEEVMRKTQREKNSIREKYWKY